MAFDGTVQNITVDMFGDTMERKYVQVQQGDTASRTIRFYLEAFEEPYEIPYGASVSLDIKKTDGNHAICSGTVEGKNTVIVTLTSQACACAGKQEAQLYLYTGEGDIRSQKFYVVIPKAVYKKSGTVSKDENDMFRATKAEMEAVKKRQEDLEKRLSSLIAASGETDGNTELQDIRNGADGVTYQTAGGAVRSQFNKKADKDDAMSWEQWFDMHRTGWHGGVTFLQFASSQSPLGTKTGDNADVVVQTSTATTKGRNDFADNPVTDLMFNGIEVNGYIDEDGDPHITAVKGSPEFARDGSNGDVYMAYLTPYYKRICTDEVEGWDFADHKVDNLLPWDDAVRPDGTVRSFYFKAKYPGVYNDDGIVGSISGRKMIRAVSHNSQIAIFNKKGPQYCGMTSTDASWAQWMNDIKFANHNSQATMAGAMNSYYFQYPATVVEEGVKRIIISKNNAKNLLVGSYVSIGYGYVDNGAVSLERGGANLHKYADDVKILKIEDYDDKNSAVYVDAPETFSTASVALNDTLTSPVYLSTMHWWSGSCDNVLGPDGSPTSCTSGKEPFVLSGVEFGHGAYTVISDIILSGVYDADSDTYSQTPYIVNDSRKIANNKLTDDYTEIGYKLPDTKDNWKYISKVGYDSRYPFLQLPTEVDASSTTGFCDGLHTGARGTSLREWLWFGALGYGARAGLRFVLAYDGVDWSWWYCALRLSSLRRGVAARG